jgi:hypothetical protein
MVNDQGADLGHARAKRCKLGARNDTSPTGSDDKPVRMSRQFVELTRKKPTLFQIGVNQLVDRSRI